MPAEHFHALRAKLRNAELAADEWHRKYIAIHGPIQAAERMEDDPDAGCTMPAPPTRQMVAVPVEELERLRAEVERLQNYDVRTMCAADIYEWFDKKNQQEVTNAR